MFHCERQEESNRPRRRLAVCLVAGAGREVHPKGSTSNAIYLHLRPRPLSEVSMRPKAIIQGESNLFFKLVIMNFVC